MTKENIKVRTRVINEFILDFSKMIIQDISEYLKGPDRVSEHIKIDIEELPQEKRIKIVFIVAYTLLYNSKRFFFESVLSKKEQRTQFEQSLYEEFSKMAQIDPLPFIKDYVDYVRKIGDSGEMQYVGSKICEVINIKDGFLLMDITTVFSSYLVNGFYQQIKELWYLSDEEIDALLT